MSNRILVFYGSYRSDRMGIRLAQFLVDRLRRRGEDVELIDARAVNLPMLDRMYKEYPKGHAPEVLEQLARKIRDAPWATGTGRPETLFLVFLLLRPFLASSTATSMKRARHHASVAMR